MWPLLAHQYFNLFQNHLKIVLQDLFYNRFYFIQTSKLVIQEIRQPVILHYLLIIMTGPKSECIIAKLVV